MGYCVLQLMLFSVVHFKEKRKDILPIACVLGLNSSLPPNLCSPLPNLCPPEPQNLILFGNRVTAHTIKLQWHHLRWQWVLIQ